MDTLTINENLIAAGIMPDHAKAIMTAIADLEYVTKADVADMATKSDLAKLETQLESDTAGMATKLDIAELKSELKSDIAELKLELKTDIASLETRLTNRVLSAAGLIIATVALFGFFGQ
ncbi:MAG: hypothetical protein ACR2PV_02250 [Gammaproteobacteria bacterium]